MKERTKEHKKNQTGITEALRGIRAGTQLTLTVNHPREIDSIRVVAYRLNAMEPDSGKKLSCKSDFRNRKITITANPV
jgi:hypothetical protein